MKHKIGIIGSGAKARRYLANIISSDFFQPIGFHSNDMLSARNLVKDFASVPFLSFEELLDQCDTLIFSQLNPESHKSIAKCLRYGKNLILSNYHYFNLTQLQQFSRIATESESLVFCGSSVLYNPALQAALNYLNNPVFIDVARLQPFSSSEGKISILNDMLVQDIDWVLQTVSSNVKRVSVNPVSVMNKPDPDFINLKLEFDNGCIANLTASRISELSLKKARLYYDKNVLYADLLNQELKRSFQHGDSVLFEEVKVDKQDEVKKQLIEFSISLQKKLNSSISLDRAIIHFQILEQIAEKIKLKSTFLSV